MDEVKFYQGLADTMAVVPGSDSEGNPMAMTMLYEKTLTEDALAYDVLTQARNELNNEALSDNDRNYWEDTVRRLVPELSQHERITAEMVPDSQTKINPQENVDNWSAALGKGVGQMLHGLANDGSVSEEENSNKSFLTDPANGQAHRDIMAAHNEMQSEAEESGWSEGGYNTAGGS